MNPDAESTPKKWMPMTTENAAPASMPRIAGIGQRVVRQALHHRARQAEAGAGDQPDERARLAQRADDEVLAATRRSR